MSADPGAKTKRIRYGDQLIVKVGDEVTAMFRDGALTYSVSGRIWQSPAGDFCVGREAVKVRGRAAEHLIGIDVLIPASDPDLPVGSIVIDRFAVAWQSRRPGEEVVWLPVGDYYIRSWTQLQAFYGPVRVVYTPEVTP